MNGPDSRAAALVADIVERFHEGHRRDLPALQALVRALAPSPPRDALAGHLDSFARELERHMFKEEMRLFPMIEQGGNALIGVLIDDITREHAGHAADVATLLALQGALPPADAAWLHAPLGRFLAALAEHAAMEESQLFAPYATAPRRPLPG